MSFVGGKGFGERTNFSFDNVQFCPFGSADVFVTVCSLSMCMFWEGEENCGFTVADFGKTTPSPPSQSCVRAPVFLLFVVAKFA